MKLISLDPGINLGWVFWVDKQPVDWGCIVEPPGQTKTDHSTRANKMAHLLILGLQSLIPFEPDIVMEGTAYWDKSHASRNAARTGSLQFLSMLVGSCTTALSLQGCKIKPLVSPTQWKGQMPDTLVKRRANSIIGERELITNIHICCAMGIGAHHLDLRGFKHETKIKTKK